MNDKENQNDTQIHLGELFGFLRKLKFKKSFFIVSVILMVIGTILGMCVIFLLFPLLDLVMSTDADRVHSFVGMQTLTSMFPGLLSSVTNTVLFLITIIYLILILKNVIRYIGISITQHQVRDVSLDLRKRLFKRALKLNQEYFNKKHTTAVHQLIIKSPSVIEQFFRQLHKVISQSLLVCVYVALLFMISWKLAIACFILFILISVITRSLITKIRSNAKIIEKESLKVNSAIVDIFRCIPIVQGFVREDKEFDLFSENSTRELEKTFESKRLINLVEPIEDFSVITAVFVLGLFSTYLLFNDTSLQTANMIIFFFLALQIFRSISSFNAFKVGLAQAIPTIHEIQNIFNNHHEFTIENGSKELGHVQKNIVMQNVSFSYEGSEREVLSDINLNIKKGQKVALVGTTGSGKSTLAHLLLRFFEPTKGSVSIDDSNIKEYTVDSLRKRISFVYQIPLLFTRTVDENISYGNEDNISKFTKLLEHLKVTSFVSQLPGSYDSLVGEGGNQLSGGQRQRLGIARALLKDHDILILDEASSSLDPLTERDIFETIQTNFADKTVIIISHKASLLKGVDLIVALKDGKIVEMGKPEELFKKEGYVYQLFN